MEERRKCIFCGNSKLSKEHIFAQWLLKELDIYDKNVSMTHASPIGMTISNRQLLIDFTAYDSGNIVPKGNQEAVLVAKRLIDGSDEYLLDLAFRYCSGIAEKAGVFKPAGTAPDDRLFATIVPMHPAKNLAAYLDEPIRDICHRWQAFTNKSK